MLSLFSLLCFVALFKFFNATSTLPSNSNLSATNQNRTFPKPSALCDSSYNCSISLGADSTCVNSVCVCDIGYKVDSIIRRCAPIDCQTSSDCPQANTECSYGSCSCKSGYRNDIYQASCTDSCQHNYHCTDKHTKCDTLVNRCVCEDGYQKIYSPLKESSSCVKDGCSYNYECPGSNTRCDYASKACVCEDGYQKKNGSGCVKFGCSYNYDCPGMNTRCDYSRRDCVCDYGYKKKAGSSLLECIKDGCSYSSDCPRANMRCDYASKECVCDYDYEMSYGRCTYAHGSSGSGSGIAIGFAIVGFIVLAAVSVVLRLACRAQRQQSRRSLVNGRGTQQTTAAVPSVPQAELRIPAGYQAGYQPQAPMFPEPYGNLQDTPPPPYSETYSPPIFLVQPQPAVQPPTDQQPSAPKI